MKRLTNLSTRGIVMKNGNTLKDVYEERVPLYMKYSDGTIDCSAKDIAHCLNEIIEIIRLK
ncbi:shikimate kinase [compost metagenome]